VINCLLGDDGILSYEDTCSITCDVGYKLISNDSTTVTCQSNGNWSDRNVVCTRGKLLPFILTDLHINLLMLVICM